MEQILHPLRPLVQSNGRHNLVPLDDNWELIEPYRAIPTAYQLILIVFALLGAVDKWKDAEGLTGTSLLKVLIMDQGLYFIV